MGAAAPRGEFKLVLTGIDEAKLPAIVAELAEVLNIDRKVATDLVGNLPVVLIGGMNQQQAATLRTHLVRLLKLGAQMSLGTDPVGKAKQLQWPAPPPILRRPAHVFMCPSCGERFIIQRMKPPEMVLPAAAPAAEPERAEAVPADEDGMVGEAVEAEEAVAEPEEAEAIPADEVEGEPMEAVAAEAEPLGEEAGTAGLDAPEAEALPATEEPIEAEAVAAAEVAEEAPAEEGIAVEAEPMEAEAIPIEEPRAAGPEAAAPTPARPAQAPAHGPEAAARSSQAPARRRAAPTAAAGPAQASARSRSAAAAAAEARRPHQAAAAPAPKPASAPAPASQGPRFDVSVAKVRGSKQEKLAELIAARQGISYEEAMKLCERTVIMVCKDAPEAEASEWRKALISAGLEPRIRKH